MIWYSSGLCSARKSCSSLCMELGIMSPVYCPMIVPLGIGVVALSPMPVSLGGWKVDTYLLELIGVLASLFLQKEFTQLSASQIMAEAKW